MVAGHPHCLRCDELGADLKTPSDKYVLMDYDLELDKVCQRIMDEKVKTVCVQLPEGLRTRGKEITDTITTKTGAQVVLWLGSCYGACDLPLQVERLGVELIVQWGHAKWG